MRLLARLLISFLVNALALFIATRLIPGFMLTLTIQNVATASALLTVINVFIRPILKLFFAPVIILTLGLGIIILNALILLALDFLLEGLIIEGIIPLVAATVLVSLVNILIGSPLRRALKKS